MAHWENVRDDDPRLPAAREYMRGSVKDLPEWRIEVQARKIVAAMGKLQKAPPPTPPK